MYNERVKRTEELQFFREITRKQREILFKKSNDYANKQDVLLNFKQMAELGRHASLANMTPTQVSLWYASMKLQRLGNLLKDDKTPNNESIEDSFIDMMNYIFLAYCNYVESKHRGKTI